MAKKHIEDTHQEALVRWAQYMSVQLSDDSVIKIGDVLYAIANGGKRNSREAARFKLQGVKAGVSDLHLPIPANGYHGLWIEMKKPIVKGRAKPTVQASQREWIEKMQNLGHKALVCFGVDEAREAIREYLGEMLLDRFVQIDR